MLSAGKLRHRIQFQRRDPNGPMGRPAPNWEDYGSLTWGHIKFLSGSESIKAGQTASKASASIRLRWRTDITADMRVVGAGMVFEVRSVLPDLLKREHVDLVCEVTNGRRS
ncbi:phage head closure protein [Comamonas thiooxydans]|uniref:phage head closure protein n=1 Tax=Comamonas thiooxydans TaxID=363952 RepID=UPI0018A4314E|nr:phage head closure protein [Comamonas thiooxydans]QOQ81122.1 phage head closure protein [Comamonas thiooxydans]